MLCLAVLVTGLATMALSLTQSLLVFYLLFCFARMNWAGPFDLGIYGAVNNWFVARRAFATSIATLAQMAGLVAMPLIAQFAMRTATGAPAGWRSASRVLVVGFVPDWLLHGAAAGGSGAAAGPPWRHGAPEPVPPEPRFTPGRGDAHTGLLAALALYRAGLPGAGRRQPAPGAAPDRARHRADHGRKVVSSSR